MSSKETILGLATRTPTEKELNTCPHVTCVLAHEWDPPNVCFPKNLHSVEEDIASNIGAVMTEVRPPDLTNTDSDSDLVDQIYDIGAMTSHMIGSFKVTTILSINVSETKAAVHYVPQAKTFQSK